MIGSVQLIEFIVQCPSGRLIALYTVWEKKQEEKTSRED